MEKLPDLDHVHVVMVATRNPLNIGAAARAMSNFGVQSLRVVNPYEASFREARSAVGAADLLAHAQQFDSVADAVADCTLVVGTTAARDRELNHPLRTLVEGGELIRTESKSGRVAILFGSEKRGLSNDDLTHCHWLLRIPTCEMQPSMNLGQAVAVTLYELARVGVPILEARQQGSTSSAKLETLTGLLMECLVESGYVKTSTSRTSKEKVRRMVLRLTLKDDDAEVLLGMFRKVLWKLKSGRAE